MFKSGYIQITISDSLYKKKINTFTCIKKGPIVTRFSAFLSGLDTLGRFSTLVYKGDNFVDVLFNFPHTKTLLKRDLL